MSGWGDINASSAEVANDPIGKSTAPTTRINPQSTGWEPRVPLNYKALAAKREDEAALVESHALEEWFSKAAKYEWDDEFGEVGPENEALKAQLFSRDFAPSVGDDLTVLTEILVTSEGPEDIPPIRNFEDAGLHPTMLENVKLSGYKRPLPVQCYCIPAVLTGRDVVGVAQTGSGKTAAYLIPVLSRLMGKAKKLAAPRPSATNFNSKTDGVRAEPLVLIICPTRELATQVFDECRRFCYRTMLRPCVVYGGAPRGDQLNDLKKGCDILIGTPGRLKDFLTRDVHWLTLARVKYTILDEADEMLKADWEGELNCMLGGGTSQDDGDHQYLMFSATFPPSARFLARAYLSEDYAFLRVGRIGSAHKNVRQDVVWVDDDRKDHAVQDLLMDLPPCRTMIFVNSNFKADQLDDVLYNADFPVTSIHSGRTQREREDAIRAFKTGKCPILVTTSISARGIDIKNVMHVINYDLPSITHGGIDEYVHRIGRTARLGNKGQATSFYNSRDEEMAFSIVKIMMECEHEIPDFLERFKPADGIVTWDEDEEKGAEEDVGLNAGGGWGSGTAHNTTEDKDGDAEIVTEANTGDAWGTKQDDSWGNNNDSGWAASTKDDSA